MARRPEDFPYPFTPLIPSTPTPTPPAQSITQQPAWPTSRFQTEENEVGTPILPIPEPDPETHTPTHHNSDSDLYYNVDMNIMNSGRPSLKRPRPDSPDSVQMPQLEPAITPTSSNSFESEVGGPVDEDQNQSRGRQVSFESDSEAIDIDMGSQQHEDYASRTTRSHNTQIHEDTEESIFSGNPDIQYPIRYEPSGNIRKTHKCWYCPSFQHSYREYLKHRKLHQIQRALNCGKCSYSCDMPSVLERHMHCHTSAYLRNTGNTPVHVTGDASWHPSTRLRMPRGKIRPVRRVRERTEVLVNIQPQQPDHLSVSAGPTRKKISYFPIIKCKDPKCPQTCNSDEKLTKHMDLHFMKNAEHQCNICTYKATRSSLMEKHYQKHNPNRTLSNNPEPPVASFCNPVRSTATARKRPLFKCPECPATFQRNDVLSIHFRRHRDTINVNTCRYCSYAVDKFPALLKHELLHSQEPGFILRPAQQSPGWSVDGGNGKRVADPADSSNNDGNGIRCTSPNCPQTFSRAVDLRNHARNHDHEQPKRFMCNKCSYGANSIQRKIMHNLLHERPASKRFGLRNQKVGMKSQNRSQKPNPGMTKTRRIRGNALKDGVVTLDEWLQIRTGNSRFQYQSHSTSAGGTVFTRSFRCLKCSTSFTKFVSWASHQNSKHGVNKYIKKLSKRFKCELCKYRTDRKVSFMNHMKRAHEDDEERSIPKTQITSFDLGNNASGFNHLLQQKDEVSTTEMTFPNLNSNVHDNSDQRMEVDMSSNSDTEETDAELQSASTLQAPSYLISQVRISNLFSIQEKVIDPFDSNLYKLSGSSDGKKSTTIVACLLGIGYDLLLQLPENEPLCGIDISEVLCGDENSSFVEITLDLTSFSSLRKTYGHQLKIKRIFTRGVKLADSFFELSHGGNISEQITAAEMIALIGQIIPSYALRFMVLNSENLRYLAENFEICDELFWNSVEKKEKELSKSILKLSYKIEWCTNNLEERNARIAFLKESLQKLQDGSYRNDPMLRQLVSIQKKELQNAEITCEKLKETKPKLEREKRKLRSKSADYIVELIDAMRKPFKKFLQAQKNRKYLGDLAMFEEDAERELVIWIKDDNGAAGNAANNQVTMDEARQIWKSMTIGKRQLAISGLYLAFWQVMDCCPVMFADAYSSSSLEFQFPAIGNLMDVIQGLGRKDTSRQFFVSLPSDSD